MEHLLGLASECRCLINRRYKTFLSTLHCTLENGTDLYVNECQKKRHYRARSAEERKRRRRKKKKKKEECQIAIFYFVRCVRKLHYYSDVIHSFDWKSAIEHDGGI